MQKASSIGLHVGKASLAARLEPLVLVTVDRELALLAHAEGDLRLDARLDRVEHLLRLPLFADPVGRRRVLPRAASVLVPDPKLLSARVNGAHR